MNELLNPVGTFTASDGEYRLSRVTLSWLGALESALNEDDWSGEWIATLFQADSWWRDVVSLTWDFRTVRGHDQIGKFVEALDSKPTNFRLWSGLPPRMSGEMIEAGFEFDVPAGTGRGMVRLAEIGGGWQAWTLFTSLNRLTGYQPPSGENRPLTAYEKKGPHDRINWLENRELERDFTEANPEVVIIGAGQGGLAIAAELRMLGVKSLIVERNLRVGDSWRQRYPSLVLHDPVWSNHLPHLPFPDSWPVYSSKDKIAGWLESYAEALELNVWTGSQLHASTYDERKRQWTLDINRDGQIRTITASHVVMATGVIGGPRMPDIPTMQDYAGELCHSSQYQGNQNRAGVRAVVVGASSSAHDICWDLFESGAEVTMVQRSSIYVMSQKHGIEALFGGLYYEGGPSLDVADLISASFPGALSMELAPQTTAAIAEKDRELLDGLEAAGFLTDMGVDGGGLFSKVWAKGGGYYINVGASELIADRRIAVKSGAALQGFTKTGIELDDGTDLEADLVVLATGYHELGDKVREIFGDEVASRIGTIWGLDSEGEIGSMWRPSGHPGLWFQGGSFWMVRLNSKFLALQIKAALLGISPASVKESAGGR